MNSPYSDLKTIFVDGEVFDYINLDRSVVTYDRLVQAIDKPLKLILFYGKPGTGKTFLLQKIYNDFKNKKKIIFLPRPFFDESSFIKALYENTFGKASTNVTNYDKFLALVAKNIKKQEEDSIIVLLDEAQLYSTELIEKIRLMADSRLFKFVFTVHKTDKEDILAKDYFKTRIWESVEIDNTSLNEIKIYIEKKLLFHNRFEYLTLFKQKHYRLILKLTQGNLRTINKLMFKLFEILEYYDHNQPSLIKSDNLDTKYLEMAGISLGMLHA